ncbi:hypothetical protein JAAARDRAFT_38013 [Jaapia argillacea MUCL 33604]|uniref:Uncharacterized protein n=1 Tax=Jaapia argillacea MUCL 33604 TaxID=933084 RepID=A0A067PUC6_9AGAM|nr:hypothetical protein JAAARDRAFT_38013 [Jaapia argillacea MUCL 33604]
MGLHTPSRLSVVPLLAHGNPTNTPPTISATHTPGKAPLHQRNHSDIEWNPKTHSGKPWHLDSRPEASKAKTASNQRK